MDQNKIGMFISEKRKELNITQEELAELMNVSKNAVSKWERGLNLPDASLMKKLCKILNISLNEFFNGEENNLELSELTKIFEKKNEKIIAVDHVTYKFEPGKLYAIMGHSGSGKSTLLSILGTLDKQTTGEYKINGKETIKLNDNELNYIRRKNVGFIFQNYLLDPNLKSYENVMLPMFVNNEIKKDERKTQALKLLEYVNLENRFNHYPKELSGGEQQRVAIARSLANNPQLIIADEPTGNLDEKNEKIIFEIFRKLANEGKLVIVVSHSDNIVKYADVVLYMKNGRLGVYNEG